MKSSSRYRSQSGMGLLGLVSTLAIIAMLALLLMEALSGRKESIDSLLDDQSDTSADSDLPAWDGSAESRLPNAIEKKVRGIQDQAAERNAELEQLLNQ